MPGSPCLPYLACREHSAALVHITSKTPRGVLQSEGEGSDAQSAPTTCHVLCLLVLSHWGRSRKRHQWRWKDASDGGGDALDYGGDCGWGADIPGAPRWRQCLSASVGLGVGRDGHNPQSSLSDWDSTPQGSRSTKSRVWGTPLLHCLWESINKWAQPLQKTVWRLLKKLKIELPNLLLVTSPVMSDSLRPIDCSTPGLPVPHHLLKFA